MNRWRWFLPAAVLITLCACAPQSGGTKTSPGGSSTTDVAGTSGPSTPAAKATLNIGFPALPCAEVDKTEGVAIRYEAERLYHSGSVLPSKEGLVCLEELADWLKDAPQNRWQVTSAGEADFGFDPQALAAKRQEMLQRFFVRKGIDSQATEWQAVAGQGPQLQLRLIAN